MNKKSMVSFLAFYGSLAISLAFAGGGSAEADISGVRLDVLQTNNAVAPEATSAVGSLANNVVIGKNLVPQPAILTQSFKPILEMNAVRFESHSIPPQLGQEGHTASPAGKLSVAETAVTTLEGNKSIGSLVEARGNSETAIKQKANVSAQIFENSITGKTDLTPVEGKENARRSLLRKFVQTKTGNRQQKSGFGVRAVTAIFASLMATTPMAASTVSSNAIEEPSGIFNLFLAMIFAVLGFRTIVDAIISGSKIKYATAIVWFVATAFETWAAINYLMM